MTLRTPEKVEKLQTVLRAKAKASPGYRFYSLYDKVYRVDVLAHAYFGLEDDTIWLIVSESIPALADQLDQVVEAEL
jgi:uncharacterized protein with HEPN domain